MSDTLKQKMVKTRKPHVCFACLKKFPAGTEMEYWVGKDGGDLISVYTCMDCLTYIRDNKLYDEDGLPEGIVADLIKEENSAFVI